MTRSARRLRALPAIAAALFSLGACSSTDVLNTLAAKGGVSVSRDLTYAPGPRHGLDVYRPASARGSAPVVVFLYGGGWDSGSKAMYGFVGDALARHGYVAVIPDYRLYPQVRWPDFLRDNAQAVRWARDHARDYGGDPGRLVLMGHSAGAYDAVALAVDGRWLAAVGLDPKRDLRAAVGLAGPYDFTPDTPKLIDIFGGGAERRPDVMPIAHVSAGEPPLFLVHDRGDTVVRPVNSEHMAQAVRAVGAPVELREYDHLNHVLLIGAVAAPLRALAPVLRDVETFIDAHTGEAATPAP